MTVQDEDSHLDKVPENLRPYVKVLGEDDALNLFLALGGTEIYLAVKSSGKSLLSRTIGREKSDALSAEIGTGHVRLPIARRWIADTMWDRGHSIAEIARVIRCSTRTVQRWFNSEEDT